MPDYTAVVSVPPILDFEIVGRPSLNVFTLTHCTGSRKRGVEGVDCSGLGDSGLIGGVTRFYCTLGLRCQKREECLQSRLFLIKLFNSNLPSRLLSCNESRAALSLATLVSMLSTSSMCASRASDERRCTSLVTPCRSSQRRNAASNGSQKPLNCRTSPMLSCRTRRSYLSSSSTRRCMTRNLVTSLSNSTIVSDLPYSEMPSSRSCCELKKGCFVRYKALDTSRIASVSVTLVHQCVHVIISESYVAVRLFRLFIVLFESFVVGDCPIGRWFESGSEDQKYLKQRTGNETAANEQPGVQIDFTSCVHLSFLLAHIYTCWLNWLCVSWPKSPRRNSVTGLVAQPLDLYDCVVLRNGIVPLCPVPISPNSAPYL
ncbi:hypothetical protein T03_14715 [Trichinella britovi]|uniref:Uncharacterized protein n=1 Tax=Trichinella britovi TaxID=45882 RepID=A0A0V1C9A9_TRIBR|nr:hypothetical protein T03_14715 [Trichinella britovi]